MRRHYCPVCWYGVEELATETHNGTGSGKKHLTPPPECGIISIANGIAEGGYFVVSYIDIPFLFLSVCHHMTKGSSAGNGYFDL